jgi:RecA-family ATPase
MSNVITPSWQQPQRPQNQYDEFTPFSPTKWLNKTAPAIPWLVDGAFIKGTVGILAGDGGLGKSLLLQQLQTAAALGTPWLGMRTEKVRSLAVYCEDDVDELHRRQERINAHYGCPMSALDGIAIESRPGRDCVLMQFSQWGGEGKRREMFDQLEFAAIQHGAKIVILDTVADVFSGNEIDRNQPRTFIRALRQLALRIQGTVILTQHPSNEGLTSGSGRSGSTGWHNSVRSRLYLTKPKGKEKDMPTNERHLKTMKQNAGQFGGKLSVTWRDGVFILTQDLAAVPYYIDRQDDGWR